MQSAFFAGYTLFQQTIEKNQNVVFSSLANDWHLSKYDIKMIVRGALPEMFFFL